MWHIEGTQVLESLKQQMFSSSQDIISKYTHWTERDPATSNSKNKLIWLQKKRARKLWKGG